MPTNTPSEIASLWGDYTFKTGQLTGLGFGAGVRYNGISYADTANSSWFPSYVVGRRCNPLRHSELAVCAQRHQFTDTTYVGSCSTPTACFYGDRRRAVASVNL